MTDKEADSTEGRIYDKSVDINSSAVVDFWNKHGENENLSSKYNYVLLHDENPDFAEKHDALEKAKIAPMLPIAAGARALDVACGIGRWEEVLLDRGVYCVGIDASKSQIERAKENLKKWDNKKLAVGLFQDLDKVLHDMGEDAPYDVLLVNAVLMYLNDDDVSKALEKAAAKCKTGAVAYFKESMSSMGKRLTLKDIWSENLKSRYSAVYRSVDEYRAIYSAHFKVIEEGPLFDTELNDREDTWDYYFLCRKE